jgi:hypothetical protein
VDGNNADKLYKVLKKRLKLIHDDSNGGRDSETSQKSMRQEKRYLRSKRLAQLSGGCISFGPDVILNLVSSTLPTSACSQSVLIG